MQPYLPERTQSQYNLRAKAHSKELITKTAQLTDNDYLVRMLYKNIYYLQHGNNYCVFNFSLYAILCIMSCRQRLCQRYCSYVIIVLCIRHCKWVAHVNLLINGDDDDWMSNSLLPLLLVCVLPAYYVQPPRVRPDPLRRIFGVVGVEPFVCHTSLLSPIANGID